MKHYYFVMLCWLTVSSVFAEFLQPKQKFHGTDEEYFTYVYRNKIWGQDEETISGPGSSIVHAKNIIEQLPNLFKEFNITTIVDAGCGNFNWMKLVDLTGITSYIGIDIVKELISDNQEKYNSFVVSFLHANIQKDPLPKADLIICRSVLPHMRHDDIFELLRNFKKSGSTYLLASHYPQHAANPEIIREYRLIIPCVPLNLEKPPFNFPKPLVVLDEIGSAFLTDKCLALWKIADLPI